MSSKSTGKMTLEQVSNDANNDDGNNNSPRLGNTRLMSRRG